ncbi:putative ras guanyl-nucleotide exchange factor RasGEF [Lophium mytilinum]|uniref:Putative ras guanyl-nucleotide exchange factor RasGEF n=1 Tax=Lophium mytilinum TaxID=390894 RepID=A0A6A6Q844_9PEZI|nr:putative ras guanyl-nucleotide exchange factor RasGEF [Lophium mytilinum]
MSSPQSPALRSLYRRILRELPSQHAARQKLSNPSTLQQTIRSRFAASAEPPALPARIQEAEQFVQYAQAQRMYSTLIERYNPGMGMDEEERVRLSARRVGMDLPKEFGKEKK